MPETPLPDTRLPENQPQDWTIITLLSWTESYFSDRAIDSPRLTAEILLAHSLGIKRLDLYLQYDRPLQQNELTQFKDLIKRRIENEPVAYITGEKGFFESDFRVEKGVLIPRPETETLVEQALDILEGGLKKNREPQRVLELGTGSGAIIVSLAKAAPAHRYVACDISMTALRVAKKNAKKILNEDRIDFFAGSWFSGLRQGGLFDLVVSNPPYIASRDITGLQPEIRNFEPLIALDGGEDGLDCYRRILEAAGQYLKPGGRIVLEMGYDQRQGLSGLAQRFDTYDPIRFVKDLSGHDRVVLIKKTD